MKNRVRSWIALGILFAVYTVVAFALPTVKNGVLWLSYLFGIIAIVAQIYILNTAFFKGKSVRSKFYGFPIANVGIVYLAVQLVLGLVFILLAAVVPLWLPLILYVVLLGIAAVGFIAADAVRDEVERQDNRLEQNVTAMRTLQSKASALVGYCEDTELGAAVRKLAENLRYSDPVSSEATTESEHQLAELMGELEQAVTDKDNNSAVALCKRMGTVLIERNQICKLNK